MQDQLGKQQFNIQIVSPNSISSKKFKVHLVGHSLMSRILKLYKKYMWSLGYSLEKLKYVSVKIAQMKMSTGEK